MPQKNKVMVRIPGLGKKACPGYMGDKFLIIQDPPQAVEVTGEQVKELRQGKEIQVGRMFYKLVL